MVVLKPCLGDGSKYIQQVKGMHCGVHHGKIKAPQVDRYCPLVMQSPIFLPLFQVTMANPEIRSSFFQSSKNLDCRVCWFICLRIGIPSNLSQLNHYLGNMFFCILPSNYILCKSKKNGRNLHPKWIGFHLARRKTGIIDLGNLWRPQPRSPQKVV